MSFGGTCESGVAAAAGGEGSTLAFFSAGSTEWSSASSPGYRASTRS